MPRNGSVGRPRKVRFMEKTQFHTLIVLQVKIIYCLLAALGLSVIAALDLYEGHYGFAAVAAGFALGLVLYAGYMLLRRRKRTSPYPEWLLVGLLSVFTLFGMHQSEQVAHWIYFVPVYTYFLFPFRAASIFTVLYSIVLVVMVLTQFEQDSRLQMLFTYAACYTFALMYALINERNNRQLAEIINTDPVTQVFNEHQLYLDLHKEMTLADRQRSSLMLVGVATPESWHSLSMDDYEQRLRYLGSRLRKHLREYDACYRLNSDDFVVLMPRGTPKHAQILKSGLLESLAEQTPPVALPVHAETYRADDDPHSLINRLMEALHDH